MKKTYLGFSLLLTVFFLGDLKAVDTWTVSGNNATSRNCTMTVSVGVPNFIISSEDTFSTGLNTIVSDGMSNGTFFIKNYSGSANDATMDTGRTIYLVDPGAGTHAGIWQPATSSWFFSVPATSLINGDWSFDSTDMTQAPMPTVYTMMEYDECKTSLALTFNGGGGGASVSLEDSVVKNNDGYRIDTKAANPSTTIRAESQNVKLAIETARERVALGEVECMRGRCD